MTTCITESCHHDKTIAEHGAVLQNLATLLSEMRMDIKEVKSVVQVIGMVQVEAAHQKESLTRVFSRLEILEKEKAHDHEVEAVEARVATIEREFATKEALRGLSDRVVSLETAKENYDAFINQVRGMKHLAYILWTVLAGGLGGVIWQLAALLNRISTIPVAG